MLQNDSVHIPSVVVIGGGPAGLMAAEAIAGDDIEVDVYDAMPSVGRKFLMAGKGGLNLTHSEPSESFLSRYGTRRPQIESWLNQLGPLDLVNWVHGLGIETYVGSSGRIFPKDMKAAPMLRAWLHRLRESGVRFHMRHRWIGWSEEGALRFKAPLGEIIRRPDAVVLALGGGSWPQLGSDAAWVSLLTEKGVQQAPLKPANCGFDVDWSDYFRTRFAGHPLKSVVMTVGGSIGNQASLQGECVLTENGIEGGLIYALSARVRDDIALTGSATIHMDLMPGWAVSRVIDEVSRPRGSRSLSSHLQSRLNIKGVKVGLLRECLPMESFNDPILIGKAIKALPIKLIAARPIEEAISSAGGVDFDAIDARSMLHAMSGVFCAGEMLDWEAPTGGYLLTACFASGLVAGRGVLDWLKER